MNRVFGKRFYLILENTAFTIAAVASACRAARYDDLGHTVRKNLGDHCILSH